MKLREQISTVCHVILFKPKSFHLSNWGIQVSHNSLNFTFSAPNTPNLTSYFSLSKKLRNSSWINFFLNSMLHWWNNLETWRNIKADSITLSGHEPAPTANQPKKSTSDIQSEKQALKIKAILPNTVNHGTRNKKLGQGLLLGYFTHSLQLYYTGERRTT